MENSEMENSESIARFIDHALLHPTMTDQDIRGGCQLAAEYAVASVCVKPYAIPVAVDALLNADIAGGSHVAVGTVIGFPHGSNPTPTKESEAIWACQQGARELDMVVNIGRVIQGDWDFVRDDILAVFNVARQHRALIKVIFETDFVTRHADKIRLCEICSEIGVDFVKTSTGFGYVKQDGGGYDYVGATESDIRLMREVCPESVGVKASGGIRDFETAKRFCDLGASRLGTSATKAIVEGQGKDLASY
jgi:deoxyribose-phosphate aldolase